MISSAGNEFSLAGIERGLRTAFADHHLQDGRRPQWGSSAPPQSWSANKGKGKAKTRTKQAFLVDPEEPEEPEWDVDEEPSMELPEDFAETASQELYCPEDDELLSMIDCEDPEAAEAFAVAAQARQKIKGSPRGRPGPVVLRPHRLCQKLPMQSSLSRLRGHSRCSMLSEQNASDS